MTSVFQTISQIKEYLYLSGAAPVKIDKIREKCITFVINATMELPNLNIRDLDSMKVHVDDSPYANLAIYFDTCADRIEDARIKGGRTLVHCMAGISRSASICIAYLMKYERLSLRSAYNHVKSRRPIVHPNPGFWKQLIDYERKLFGKETVKMISSTIGMIPDVYEDERKNMVYLSSYR